MLLVALQPQWNRRLEKRAAGLLAALPDLHNDLLLKLGVGRFRSSFPGPLPKTDLAVEGLDRALALPDQGVAELVNHRASSRTIPTRIARPAAFQIFDLALLSHDSG